MSKWLKVLVSLFLFIGAIALFNLGFFISEGTPRIPDLASEWWAGFYETQILGKVWCVAAFEESDSGSMRMALISPFGSPDIYTVARSSSDRNFVELSFEEAESGMKMKARQLYVGKRYIFQRLLAGRFGGFWNRNEDIAIRGEIIHGDGNEEWAIEPIDSEGLALFWQNYLAREDGSSPEALLEKIGFPVPGEIIPGNNR